MDPNNVWNVGKLLLASAPIYYVYYKTAKQNHKFSAGWILLITLVFQTHATKIKENVQSVLLDTDTHNIELSLAIDVPFLFHRIFNAYYHFLT